MPAIELLTLNAHMGFSVLKRRFMLPELRAAIRALPADLVFLQEVLGEHQVHAGRHADWPAQSQYAFLADARWPQFAYGRNAVYPHGHHGNALLSRFPIASCVNRDVSIAGHEHRGLLHAVLEIPGHAMALHAVCVHLGLREAHRRRQIGLLGALIADLPAQAPLIVAGDFNDWRQRGHRLLQRHGLTEAFAQLHGRVARSFPARWPLLPLDRIYLRNVRIESARVLTGRPWSQLSDHAPLQARIAV